MNDDDSSSSPAASKSFGDDDSSKNNNDNNIKKAEQSGYFILDLRKPESFYSGPWLELVPKQQQENEESKDTSAADGNNNNTTRRYQMAQVHQQQRRQNLDPNIRNRGIRAKTCHIPLAELQSRLFELPAKRTNLIFLYDSEDDVSIAENILGDGWNIVDEFQMLGARNMELIQTHPARSKWVQDASWLVKPFLSLQRPKNKSSNTSDSLTAEELKYWLPFSPDELRGWSPSPFLEKHLDSTIVPALLRSSSSSSFYTAVDIGSGNGRDIAYLASRGLFHTVFAIDNRHHLLENCVAITKRYACSSNSNSNTNNKSKHVPTTCHGLSCTVSTSLPLREESFDLIVCVRFLERQLLTSLARHLKVGGFLLYSHFVDGVQHSAVGQPKNPKAFVLHHELKKKIVDEAILPKRLLALPLDDDDDSSERKKWKIQVLVDEEVLLEDGRPVNNLLIVRLG